MHALQRSVAERRKLCVSGNHVVDVRPVCTANCDIQGIVHAQIADQSRGWGPTRHAEVRLAIHLLLDKEQPRQFQARLRIHLPSQRVTPRPS